jgi:micrococcal nuclease
MYTYRCIIDRVVDGDTVDVDIDLGFDTWLMRQRVRLVDIDTPEIRTLDKVEKHFGELATKFVEKHLHIGQHYELISKKYNAHDSYARILGTFNIYYDDRWISLTDVLLQNHMAVKYRPHDREFMLQEHLENRKILIKTGVSSLTLAEAGIV